MGQRRPSPASSRTRALTASIGDGIGSFASVGALLTTSATSDAGALFLSVAFSSGKSGEADDGRTSTRWETRRTRSVRRERRRGSEESFGDVDKVDIAHPTAPIALGGPQRELSRFRWFSYKT